MIEPHRFRADNHAGLKDAADYILRLKVGPREVVEITVKPESRHKTGSQRGYWHAMLDELGRAWGYTPSQMKEVVKREYYGADTIKLPDGRKYEVVQSSEAEDREGYGRLIDFTLQLAAEQRVERRARAFVGDAHDFHARHRIEEFAGNVISRTRRA